MAEAAVKAKAETTSADAERELTDGFHLIIDALESRDTELAEKRAREHTLGLAGYVEAHGQELF